MMQRLATPAALMMAISPPADAANMSAHNETIERRYCTQYGPFFIRFDPDKAAGVFAINSNNDLGSIVGALNDRTLEGEWIEVGSHGKIRIAFSEDWSRFEAEYTVADNPDQWRGEWTGRIPPNADTDSFDRDGVTFDCR